ncbi:hypothetical protein ZTR_03933 [Talaromyces verruculosus]|nr:hypothetical protein ZTR_03933 [Talaromyces verruculosus]
MSLITPNQSLLSSSLKGLVVVLTGGAQGVGQSVVEQLHAAGAKIIFGDVNDTLATKLTSTLNSKATDSEERVHFVHCDTSNYANQLHLFQTAYNLYKRIDIVIANAAIAIHMDPFTAAHESDEAILSAPSLAEIDVNLKGLLYTTRLGLHYLRKNPTTTSSSGYKGDVVLVSSIAGFKESAGHTTYTASKHGVIGVMRGLALEGEKEGIRVNTLGLWLMLTTETRMVTGIEQGWVDRGLPSNEAADVANAILICATANRSIGLESEQQHEGAALPFNGKIVYVAGGKSYEIEDRIQALEPEWMGRGNSEILEKGQEFLHSGTTSWETSK